MFHWIHLPFVLKTQKNVQRMRNWNYAQSYTLFSIILSKLRIFSKEVFTKRTNKILLDLTQKTL